jgi:hypothetical protein
MALEEPLANGLEAEIGRLRIRTEPAPACRIQKIANVQDKARRHGPLNDRHSFQDYCHGDRLGWQVELSPAENACKKPSTLVYILE